MKHLLKLLFCLALWGSLPLLSHAADVNPSTTDKCPVCGMFVNRYPDWLATITFKSGERVYFDGPKDLFNFYLNMAKYQPGKSQATITALTVKEYYGLKTVNAKSAFFVSGSDVFGPMGKELVPFASLVDARSFQQDHKGKILRFNEITPAILQRLQ